MRLNLFGKRKRFEMTSEAMVEVMREHARVLGPCAQCGAALSGHEYARLATEILDEDKASVTRFFQAVKDRDWLNLKSFQRWGALRDNIEAFAVRCPGRHLVSVCSEGAV